MSGFMHKPDNSRSHQGMEEKVKNIYPYTFFSIISDYYFYITILW